ncbi:MAG TPA: FAD-dependent oxidoreductase [Vicinamibacterales bacterium]|jgi:thioredoxin reductase (NADPH)|nr:FAD-dependent oxidoreductase [Vicinamibacterales bacterium]
MTKPLILTVDDDPQVLRAIARDLVARYGRDFRVARAQSGAEALEILRHERESAQPVALLVSDQRMPQQDGVQFLAEARTIVPAAKRALLTAYADTDAAIAAINTSQVDYYLQKPWDPPGDHLYPIIDDLLEDWRGGYRPGWGGVRVVGSRWMPSVHALKEFLARNHVPYEFFDIESTDERGREARELGGTTDALPLVIMPDGERLSNPTVDEVARRSGLKTEATQGTYDVAIVGAGPAGLAAAVYAASEGLKTVLLDREAPGGQAGTSSRIENYLGFPSGLSGQDLARRALTQARRFEVEVLSPIDVKGLRVDGPFKHLQIGDGGNGHQLSCKALVLTMGLAWQRLPAACAEQYEGRGIYYGAATTEALSCRGEVVYIVGAGNSAGQAAMHLVNYARKVVMVVRGRDLGDRMSQYLVKRIGNDPRIEVQARTEVVGCRGADRLEGLTLKNLDTGATQDVDAGFLFVFIGAFPQTEWLGNQVARDARGFILTGPDLDRQRDLKAWPLEREPFLLEASVPGVFAAGDVRHESVKRVASAVGEGSVSVHFIHRYLASL